MIVCSIRKNDARFAKQFLSKKTEYANTFTEEALATIVSYYMNSTDITDPYSDFNAFESYLKRMSTNVVGKKDFKLYSSLRQTYLDNGGKDGVLEYEEGSKNEDLVTSLPALFEVFKDNVTGKRYAILKSVQLDEHKSDTIQDRTVDILMEMSTRKAKFVRYNDPEDYNYRGENVWEYNGTEITAISVSNDINNEWEKEEIEDIRNQQQKEEHKKKIQAPYPVLSNRIGTLVDHIVRDFFDENSELYKIIQQEDNIEKLEGLIESKYGQLITPTGVLNLVNDLRKVQDLFEKEFGKGYVVISKEIPLFAKNPNTGKWITGSPDLLVVDTLGVVHVIDLKTKLASNDFNKNVKRSDELYASQVTRYIKMLQAYGLKVADSPTLLLAESYGDSISNEENEEKGIFEVQDGKYGEVSHISILDPEDEEGENYITLEEYIKSQGNDNDFYSEPRIHFPQDDKDVKTLHSLKFDKEGLPSYQGVEDENTNDLLKEMLGTPKIRSYSAPIIKLGEDDLFSNPSLIGAEEIQFVADHVMYIVSEIVEEVKKDNTKYTELTRGIDYRDRDSSEIIHGITIQKILDYIIDDLFNIDEITADDFDSVAEYNEWLQEDEGKLYSKKQFLRAHKSQLLEVGYAKLLSLEDSLVLQSTTQDKRHDSGDNNSVATIVDRIQEGLSDKEAWMMGERHYSPKASLAQELKRIFERIIDLDEEGNPIADPYGYGFRQHVNSTMAIESILNWCSPCETLEEMMNILELQASYSSNHWLKNVLNTVNADENLKKKFFRHFRKDSTKYSICRARYKDGKMTLETRIINTKSAADTMKQSLDLAFREHSVGDLLDSTGKVQSVVVSNILKELANVQKEIRKIYKEEISDNTSKYRKTPEYKEEVARLFEEHDIYNKVTDILNKVGIMVTDDIVKGTVFKKLTGTTTNNAFTLLTRVNGLLSNLNSKDFLGREGISLYDKAGSHSIYYFYKNLIELLADSVQEHVESSVYQDGKTYYSYCNPSYLMHQIRNLKDALNDSDKFEEYIQKEFGRYTGWYTDEDGRMLVDWISRLSTPNDRSAREVLDHKVQLTYNNTQYKNLGALGFQLSILTEYFGSKSDPEGTAWYALPTMSNKPTSEFIRFYKYSSHADIVNNVLYNTFLQETNRIVDVLEAFAEGKVQTDQIDITEKKLKKEGRFTKEEINELKDHINNGTITVEDMHRLSKVTSGAKFHFLYYLNDEMGINSEAAELMVGKINSLLNGEEYDNAVDLVDVMKATLSNRVKEIVEEEFDKMVEMGIMDTQVVKLPNGKTKTVFKYQERFGGNLGTVNATDSEEDLEKARASMEKALKDFIWNDIAANINIIQITGGDLAYYGNSVNYQKRIAQIHSPGLHLSSEVGLKDGVDDGFLRSVHIADEKAVSEVTQNAIAALEEMKNNLPIDQQGELTTLIKVIAAGFEEIDVTDGQSFACPTSYRKKAKLQGEWSEEMEEAYNRIRSGNFDINDLGIMWNPTKPFVTAQLPKYSGSSTMTFRKKPLQDKNSEYMLLLAEALSFQAGKESKMTAIYDWMESTHWDKYDYDNHKPANGAKYQRNGIDTVHFASVGKVGLDGIIDFSEKTYDRKLSNKEIIDMLNEATAFNQDYSSDEEYTEAAKQYNDIDQRYNDRYVDTIPVENYIIQQEVPAHLLEHEQLYGSQIRILGISDITPGTSDFVVNGKKIADEDLVEEYKELHAKNIRESFDELMEELGLKEEYADPKNPTVEERNKRLEKLEAILHKEILKDSKYGYDIKRACTLQVIDEKGNKDFLIPLLDPIQSNRIQMLLNSIIKRAINKQKIKGGPVVQTTVYDKDLHIVFKGKDGKPLAKTRKDFNSDEEYKAYVDKNQDGIAYFECYAPVPNAKLEKLITNPDGSLMSVEEIRDLMGDSVWDTMSQIIGYRIPTEDKYSMVPLKIKGFVPKAAGQVIMMPKEITYLTGSDFDIDKMYLMLKSFDETDLDLNSLIKQLKKDYHGNFEEYFKNILGSNNNGLKSATTTTEEVRGILERLQLGHRIPNSKDPRVQKLSEWYRKTAIKSLFVEYKDQNAKSAKKRREARNNRILDLQWSVLTHRDTASKMMNPGNFNIQKRTGRIIKILKAQAVDPTIVNPTSNEPWTVDELRKLFDTEGANALDAILEGSDIHSVTLPTNKVYFQQQNMQGTQMVGIFANHNVSHAFVSFQNIGIDLTSHNSDKSFWFNGVQIGNPNNMLVIDRVVGHDGKLISKTIAEFLAASVDTAKDPTLRDLNVNTFTGNVAMTLARLGFDTESIGLFLAQPIIQKVTETYFRNSNEGFYQGTTAIKEVWKGFFKDNVVNKDLNNTNALDEEAVTKETLIENIGTELEYDENGRLIDPFSDENDFQRRVLIMFNSLYAMSQNVTELTFCTKFNSVSNAAGPTIAATAEKTARYERFRKNVADKKTCFYVPENDDEEYTHPGAVVENDPILNAFYETTISEDGAVNKIFSPHFPHYLPGFQSIIETLSTQYLKNEKVNDKLYNQLINDYIFYMLTYDDPLIEDTEKGIRATLPSSKEEMDYYVKGMVKRFNALSKRKNRPANLILDQGIGRNCLRIIAANDYLPMDTLEFRGGQLNAEDQERVKAAWSDLITSEDNEMRSFGIDLFYYTLLRNGFGFSPKTLMHLASTIVRQNAHGAQEIINEKTGEVVYKPYTGYIDGLRNLRNIDQFLMQDANRVHEFIRMFVRNHSNNIALVPIIQRDNSVYFENEEENDSEEEKARKRKLISIGADENEKYILDKVMLNNDTPCRFIMMSAKVGSKTRTILYELDTTDSPNGISEDGTMTYVTYKMVGKLGLTNNFLEYNANDSIETSYFDKIREEAEADEYTEDSQEDTGATYEDGEEEGEIDWENNEAVIDLATELQKKAKEVNSKARTKSSFITLLADILRNSDGSDILLPKSEIVSRVKEILSKANAEDAEDEIINILKENNIC